MNLVPSERSYRLQAANFNDLFPAQITCGIDSIVVVRDVALREEDLESLVNRV